MVENKIYVSTSVPAEKRCSICVFIFVKRVSFLFRSISFYIPILFFLEVSPHFDPYAARQHCTGSRANDSPEREIYLQLHEDRTSTSCPLQGELGAIRSGTHPTGNPARSHFIFQRHRDAASSFLPIVALLIRTEEDDRAGN
jgi:hypothetical protein